MSGVKVLQGEHPSQLPDSGPLGRGGSEGLGGLHPSQLATLKATSTVTPVQIGVSCSSISSSSTPNTTDGKLRR